MTEHIVCDLDDFCDKHAGVLHLLDELYDRSEGRFKVTLFTIPGLTSSWLLDLAKARPWVELAVHGWDHRYLECKDWTRERALEVLGKCGPPYVRLFKAPYWKASPALYEALNDEGWAVADHPENVARLPMRIKRYVLSPYHQLGMRHAVLPITQAHGHMTNETGNGIRENFGTYIGLAQRGLPFKWVTEVLV